LTRIYVCRKCKKKYSLAEFKESHFCRECETFLSARIVHGRRSPRRTVISHRRAPEPNPETNNSDEKWLPRGYEIREGQVKFIEEATQALENNQVFVGSAPCGIGKSLASLLTVLPRLGKNKLIVSFRTRSQLHIFLKEIKGLKQNPLTVSFFSKKDMCPLRLRNEGSYYDFLEECRRLKKNCESGSKPFCRYYWNIQRKKREAEMLALDCAKRVLDPKESTYRLAKNGLCAYVQAG
jgi:hypothetical protein